MHARGSKAVTAALLAINGVLALILWLQLGIAPGMASSAIVPAAPRAPQSKLPTMLPTLAPISAFNELNERPLFWIERRALPEAKEVASEAVPVQMPFILLGVVTAGKSHAVLGRTASKDVSRVYVGDIADGWLVESIAQNSVSLVANGVRRELYLGSRQTGDK